MIDECGAHLYLADNYGDSTCTMRCRLRRGHPAGHCEAFTREGEGRAGTVQVFWENDEREESEKAEATP